MFEKFRSALPCIFVKIKIQRSMKRSKYFQFFIFKSRSVDPFDRATLNNGSDFSKTTVEMNPDWTDGLLNELLRFCLKLGIYFWKKSFDLFCLLQDPEANPRFPLQRGHFSTKPNKSNYSFPHQYDFDNNPQIIAGAASAWNFLFFDLLFSCSTAYYQFSTKIFSCFDN